jgi:hypothetical protein
MLGVCLQVEGITLEEWREVAAEIARKKEEERLVSGSATPLSSLTSPPDCMDAWHILAELTLASQPLHWPPACRRLSARRPRRRHASWPRRWSSR